MNQEAMQNSYLYRKDGWTYLHIEGEPYERGFQHGYLLADSFPKIMETLKRYALFNTGKTFEFFMDAAHRVFFPRLDGEYVEEIQGIAAGAEAAGVLIPFDALLVWNGFVELLYYWWPHASESGTEQPAKRNNDRCSAFIATGTATKDHGIVMAHNTWIDYVLGQYFNVILDIVPTSGNRLLMQTAPGYIHSFTDFFMTGAGIIGTETTIRGFSKFREDGAPSFFRMRKASQYGRSLDEWVLLMQENNNGGVADSWLLGDIRTNEIARFEQGLEYSSFEKLKNGVFTGFNAPEDARIRNLECGYTGYTDVRDNGARRVRLRELIDGCYGRIDCEIAKRILEDHFDVYLQKSDHPSNRTLCGHSEVDPRAFVGITGGDPYSPEGAVDGKVVSSGLAKDFAFWARFGRSCAEPFYAENYLRMHPQWDWLRGLLEDRPSRPWTILKPE